MLLPVTSTARTSSVFSSIPMCILRQIRRLEPPTARQHMLACVRGMLAGIPLTFALCFDACAIDQEVQRPSSTAIWQTYFQRYLTAVKGAEVWYRPIQPDELQQALHKTCGLSQRQAEQHFQSETRLDRSITIVLLPTTLAARRWQPNHLRIKPNGQRATALQTVIV